MKIYQFAVLLFLITAPIPLALSQDNDSIQTESSPLTLTNQQDVYPLRSDLEILIDKNAGLTFNNILSSEFNSNFKPINQIGIPPIAAAYWLRFQIRNQAKPSTQWLLIYDNYRIGEISVYTPSQNGTVYTEKHTGNSFPFSSRDFAYHYYVFHLEPGADAVETIYIRLFDTSGYIDVTPLKIQSLDSFTHTAIREYFWAGAYYFVILTVFLYNLFYIFSLRDRAVLNYTVFLLAAILVSLSNDGFGHQFLWPNWSRWAGLSILLSILMYLASLLNYTNVVLEVEQYLPRWAMIIKILVGIFVILVLFRLTTNIDSNFLLPPIIGCIIAGFTLPIFTGLRMLSKQKRQALIFLLAFVPYLVLILVLVEETITRSNLLNTNYLIQIALVWALLVFSFLPHDRINTIRKEHEQAQEQLILKQQEALRIQTEFARAMKDARDDILTAYDTTLEGWARLLELRDKETEGHSRNVTELTVHFARELGVSPEAIVHMRRGALLHDIGKISVPDRILLKPGPLTDEEWEIMRRHPLYAKKFLSGIPYLEKALEIPVYHHEHWNGEGYPFQLKGENIPLAARIFTIVDNWDALLSDRPYRNAWPAEKIIEYMEKNAGAIFDPFILEKFFAIIR
jgi:HD-GYP domain-containing protein (c-di-GMP phosphodiesterase class II)